MEEESWERNHGRGIMEKESWERNHGKGIMGEESWKRNHGRGIETLGRHLGAGVAMGGIWVQGSDCPKKLIDVCSGMLKFLLLC